MSFRLVRASLEHLDSVNALIARAKASGGHAPEYLRAALPQGEPALDALMKGIVVFRLTEPGTWRAGCATFRWRIRPRKDRYEPMTGGNPMQKSLLIAAAIVALTSSFAFADTETREFDGAGLQNLKVKNTSGDVRVTLSADQKATVAADKVKFGKDCKLEMKRFGDDLLVTVEGDSWLGSWFKGPDCKVNFEIKVPQKIAANVRNGSGDVEIIGTQGAVEIAVGSGNVAVNADTKEVNIKTGSGSVQAKGLTGNTFVKTGSGNITLAYAVAPAKGEVDVKTGSGDATLVVPPATKLLSDFKAGSGRLLNEIGDTADADFKVSMRAGSGDLKIKKAE